MSTETDGPAGKYAVKELEGEEPDPAWKNLPDEISSGCDPTKYKLLVTSVSGSTDKHKLKVKSETEDDVDTSTDRCLIGTWEINQASRDAFFESTAQKMESAEYTGSSGTVRLHIHEGGRATATVDQLEGRFRITTLLGFKKDQRINTEVIQTTNGSSCGRYSADGYEITQHKSSDNIKMTARHIVITGGGVEIDTTKVISLEGLAEEWAEMAKNPPRGTTAETFSLPGMSGAPSASEVASAFEFFTKIQPYQCNSSTLRLKLPIPGEEVWIDYRRISRRPD